MFVSKISVDIFFILYTWLNSFLNYMKEQSMDWHLVELLLELVERQNIDNLIELLRQQLLALHHLLRLLQQAPHLKTKVAINQVKICFGILKEKQSLVFTFPSTIWPSFCSRIWLGGPAFGLYIHQNCPDNMTVSIQMTKLPCLFFGNVNQENYLHR